MIDMDYDIDATQVLDLGLDIPDDETAVKREIGKLKTQQHRSLAESEFSIHEGTNIIGRDDKADIVVKLQSLSKKHACIEVTNDIILVYDLDSRNKSRKGELLLKPYVRYDVKDGDLLTFGDLKCEFLSNIAEDLDETKSLSGSETGSESLIPEDEEEIVEIIQDDVDDITNGERTSPSDERHDVQDDVDDITNGERTSPSDERHNDVQNDNNDNNGGNLSDYIIMPTQMRNEEANTSGLSDSIIMPTQEVGNRTFSRTPDEMMEKNNLREAKDKDVFACDSDMEDSEGKTVPETPGYGLTNRTKSCISESPLVQNESSNEGSVSLVSPPRQKDNAYQKTFQLEDKGKLESDDEEIVGTYVFDTAGFDADDDNEEPQTYQFDTSEFNGGECGDSDEEAADDGRDDCTTPNEENANKGDDRRKTFVVEDDDDDATQPYKMCSPVKIPSPFKKDTNTTRRNSFPTLPGGSMLPGGSTLPGCSLNSADDEGVKNVNENEDNEVPGDNGITNYDDLATQMYESQKPAIDVDNYDNAETQMYENINDKPSDDTNFDDVATQMYIAQNDTVVSQFEAVDMATDMTMHDNDMTIHDNDIDNACTQMYIPPPQNGNNDDDATPTYEHIDDAETQLYTNNTQGVGTSDYDDVATQLYTNNDTSYDDVSTQLYALDDVEDKCAPEKAGVSPVHGEDGTEKGEDKNKQDVEEEASVSKVKSKKRRSVRFSLDGTNMFRIPDKNDSPTEPSINLLENHVEDNTGESNLALNETKSVDNKEMKTKSYPARQNKGKRFSDESETSVVVNEDKTKSYPARQNKVKRFSDESETSVVVNEDKTKSYPARQNKGKRFSDESEISVVNTEPVSKKSKKDQGVTKRGGRGKKAKGNPSLVDDVVEGVTGESVRVVEHGGEETVPSAVKKPVNPPPKKNAKNARSARQARSRMPSKVVEEPEIVIEESTDDADGNEGGKKNEDNVVEGGTGESVPVVEDVGEETVPNTVKETVNPPKKNAKNARSTRQARSRMPPKLIVSEIVAAESTDVADGNEGGKKNEDNVVEGVTGESVPLVENGGKDADSNTVKKPVNPAPKKNAKSAKSTRQARSRMPSKLIEDQEIVAAESTDVADGNEGGKKDQNKIDVNVNGGAFLQNAPTRSRRTKKPIKDEKSTNDTVVDSVDNGRKVRSKKGKTKSTEEIPPDNVDSELSSLQPDVNNSKDTATKAKYPRARIPSTSSKRKAELMKESVTMATLDSVSSISDVDSEPTEIRSTKNPKTAKTTNKKKGNKKTKIELESESNIQSTPKKVSSDSKLILPVTPNLCPSNESMKGSSASKIPLADNKSSGRTQSNRNLELPPPSGGVDTDSADSVSNSEETKPTRSRNMRGNKKGAIKSKLQTKRLKEESNGKTSGEGKEEEEDSTERKDEGKERLVPASPRRSMCKPKVIFTGMNDKTMEKIVTDLGGEIVENVMHATHLVTDKVRRTVKFLCAVGRGLHIVHPEWLLSSKSAKCFTACQRHTLKDEGAERQYKFQLRSTLEKANERPLFQNKTIYVTKNVKPERSLLKEMIESAGGTYVARVPKTPSEDTIVVSCAEDEKEYEKLVAKGFIVCTKEIILSGLLRQQLDTEHFSIGNIGDPDASQISLSSDNSILSTTTTTTAASKRKAPSKDSPRKGKRRK